MKRRLALFAECTAWLMVMIGVGAVLVNLKFARELIRGAVDGRRLPHEELGPRDLLIFSYAAVEHCLGAPSMRDAKTEKPLKLRYDPLYHARISRGGFATRAYPEPSSGSPDQRRLAACMASEVFNSLELKKWERVEPRVMWVYFYIEAMGEGVFSTWPAFEIPRTFRPAERPWAYDQILAANAGSGEFGVVKIYSTRPYRDAFTGETIISLSTPIDRGDWKVSLAVDVRAGARPGLYSLSLLFNLFVCAGVAIGSLLIAREFHWKALSSWYRGWLVMAVLYSAYVFVFFVRSEGFAQNYLRDNIKAVGFILSLINSVFFGLAGYFLVTTKSQARTVGRVWGFSAAVVIAALALEKVFPESALSPIDAAEAIVSFFALVTLGGALALISWRCGAGHHSSVLRWARPTVGLVVVVFFGYAALQLSIPFFGLWPMAEELFWPASVLMKVAMIAVFFVVMLMELYLEKVEVNEIFLTKFPEGILAVDANWRVSNANDYAIADLGIPRAQIRSKHLSEILFGSWFEAERFYEKLRVARDVEDFAARIKRFTGNSSCPFEIRDGTVSAVLIGASEGRGKERAHALVFIHPGSGS